MCRLARGDLEFVVVLSSVLFLFFRQEFAKKSFKKLKTVKLVSSVYTTVQL
jgi:hypothetical protein